jgi:hypothetical protein
MFNPLVDNFSELTDTQLELKISDLQKKYFLTHNNDLRQQIVNILNMYKSERISRLAKSREKDLSRGNPDLDELIKVN